ncbi:uncharacterized protein VNE69_02058 [Vairimorpha necatrix]|uniref:Uncharacterized protein n=1 Tax=Vairimorpha necatrix TaxID=6039 RepID=A0AAX4J9E0_9MICR
MLVLFFYSITIFCSDYIFIDKNSDTEISLYVSLNNLDNLLFSSLLVHKQSSSECYKEKVNNIMKMFENEITNPPYCFKPVNDIAYTELKKLLESVQFDNNEELEMAKLFYKNKYILKTTFNLENEKLYYIEQLFVKGNPQRYLFKGICNDIFNENKNIMEIKWLRGEYENSKYLSKDVNDIYCKCLFNSTYFYHTEDKEPLEYKQTKDTVNNESKQSSRRIMGIENMINHANETEKMDYSRSKYEKNLEEYKQRFEQIIQDNSNNSNSRDGEYRLETNIVDILNDGDRELDQCYHIDDDNGLNSNNEYNNVNKDEEESKSYLIKSNSKPKKHLDKGWIIIGIILIVNLGILSLISHLMF